MGTLLQEKGLQPGELPEVWNLEHAEEVMEIHREYYKAGSDIVLANTFGANALKFHDDRYGLKALIITAAITNARKVADKITAEEHREVYVAMDMGPPGKLLKAQPWGTCHLKMRMEYVCGSCSIWRGSRRRSHSY